MSSIKKGIGEYLAADQLAWHFLPMPSARMPCLNHGPSHYLHGPLARSLANKTPRSSCQHERTNKKTKIKNKKQKSKKNKKTKTPTASELLPQNKQKKQRAKRPALSIRLSGSLPREILKVLAEERLLGP